MADLELSTTEEFHRAPIGSTADNKLWVKVSNKQWYCASLSTIVGDEEMAYDNRTLDKIDPEDALNLLWVSCHKAKEGDILPDNTRYIRIVNNGKTEIGTYTKNEHENTEETDNDVRNTDYLITKSDTITLRTFQPIS